jgi:NAD kinase
MANPLCLYCGSFNPPGLHHQAVAAALSRVFPSVRVIPCGPRPDKPSSNAVPFAFRAALADLAFRQIPRVTTDLFDLEQDCFTRNDDLEARFALLGEVWHAVPAESVLGGASGQSIIQKWWRDGPEVWRKLRFAVFHHSGQTIPEADLPPQHRVIPVEKVGSSQQLRRRLYEDLPCEEDMDPAVLSYIRRYGLYGLAHPRLEADFRTDHPRFLVVTADRNPRAEAWRERLAQFTNADNPNAVLVIGGDGTMLRAIQSWWRLRVPFIGLNAGHLGFLMNESEELVTPTGALIEQLTVRLLPMLRIRFQRRDGTWVEHLSFNDAWVERHGGQPAWLRVSVNGEVKLEKLICDGALVSTAAGSTAYARSMGGPPLLADTGAWLVVGSNVMRPLGWKSALLPMNATVRIESIDTERRPINGSVCGETIPDVITLEAQISRIATVELAFSSRHDMARKISDLHFGTAGTI